ncbi:uncharacterized protein LOC129959148 [Argiope bruennichi]|uniref:uncharacterized protein LOC129959148 n=1 Tax=Argiope bruennichi TaxID=94029 RepID=UPI0024956E5B|nr:uncharacterized protein LOC129959148 [Argiope bruennichi]
MNMSQQSDSADPEEVWESEDLYEQILSDTNMSQPCESANLEQCGSEDLSDQKLTDINMSQPCGYTNLELYQSKDPTDEELTDINMSEQSDFADLVSMREPTCLKCSTPVIKKEFMYLYSLSLGPNLTKARFLQCLEYLFNERRYGELFERMISAQKHLVDRVDKEQKYARRTEKKLVDAWRMFGEYLEKLVKKLQEKKPEQGIKRKRKRNEQDDVYHVSLSVRCCEPEYLSDPKLADINMSLPYESVDLEEYKSREPTDRNMRQRSGSADLVAQREPTSLQSLLQCIKKEFIFLYAYTVEVNLSNCGFLPAIENCFNARRYEKLLKEMLGRQKSVLEQLHLHRDKEANKNLISRWKRLGENIKQLEKKYQRVTTPKQVKHKSAESTFAGPENISQNDKGNSQSEIPTDVSQSEIPTDVSQSEIPTDVRSSEPEDRPDQELGDINVSHPYHCLIPHQYKSMDLPGRIPNINISEQSDSADLVPLREPTTLIGIIQYIKKDFIILYSDSMELTMTNVAVLGYMERLFADKRYGKLMRLMLCEQRNVLRMLDEQEKDDEDLKRVVDWIDLGRRIEQLQNQLQPGATTKLVKRKLAESTIPVPVIKIIKRNEKENESPRPTVARCDDDWAMIQDLSDDIDNIHLSEEEEEEEEEPL